MNLSDDPAHVGAGKKDAKVEEWKDTTADKMGGASYTDKLKNAAAGTTEYGKKLASTVYEKVAGAGTAVGVHWDTAEAKYPSASPEPERDYGLAVVADAELALLLGAGAAARELSRRLSLGAAVPRGAAGLVSRREQLRGAAAAHVTRCRFRDGGDEHEVAVHACRGGDGLLRVSIDGEKVAEVRRVGWGFRGNRAAVLADGEVVDVMWDVHDWWFGGRGGAGAGAQFMVKARAEEGRLWMADATAARGQSPGGFFLHVQCYRR